MILLLQRKIKKRKIPRERFKLPMSFMRTSTTIWWVSTAVPLSGRRKWRSSKIQDIPITQNSRRQRSYKDLVNNRTQPCYTFSVERSCPGLTFLWIFLSSD